MTTRRARQDQEARRRLRRRLEAQRIPQHLINRQIERLRARQAAARRANVPLRQLDAIHDQTHARLRLDDTGYKPHLGDPLLRGDARAQGATARAVTRRSKATTRYELTHQEPP